MAFGVIPIDSKFYRLIPSRFPPVDLCERLSPSEEWPELHAIEDLTNPRVRERQYLTGVSSVEHGSPQLQNWNHAPFAYQNPEGSWLLDPFLGNLELADCLQTALAMSIRRRELFLSRTLEPALSLDMRVLQHGVSGMFADLTGLDPQATQDARWEAGELALRSGVDGAVFACPVRPGARCISVFKAAALEKSVQTEHFRFVWDGDRIRALYAFSNGEMVAPEAVFAEGPMRRAA